MVKFSESFQDCHKRLYDAIKNERYGGEPVTDAVAACSDDDLNSSLDEWICAMRYEEENLAKSLQLLLPKVANLSQARCPYGHHATLLLAASMEGDDESVRLLLDAGFGANPGIC